MARMFSTGVLSWRLWQGAQDVPGAVPSQRLHFVDDLRPHVLRRAEGHYLLVVDAAVEADLAAERILQFGRLHAGTAALDGVQHVDAHLNEVRYEGPDGAVVVVEHDKVERFREFDRPLHVGPVELAKHLRADHEALLRSEIVGDLRHQGQAAGRFETAGVVLVERIGDLLQQVVRELRPQQHVHQGLLEASEHVVVVEDGGVADFDGPVGVLCAFAGQGLVVVPFGLRPRKGVEVLDGLGMGQGVVSELPVDAARGV